MARQLTDGQRAAVRAAKARRGELGLTQKELAQAAGVTVRTVEMFEAFRTWPRADTLAQLERLGLSWPVGYLNEYAAKHQHSSNHTSSVDRDIADIMNSNLHPDLKLRLIDRLRAIDQPRTVQQLKAEIADLERRLGEGDQKGSGAA